MRKKSFKSALTVLLSLMMILVMFPANAFAMDGEGTKENPYEIATADDLYEFAIKVNEGDNTACAVLTADITLFDTNWTPIGNDSNQYKGTFDGDGHTITGLSVDIQSDNTIYAGLFGFLGEGGTIKNLGLADSKITCSGNRVYAGGVCGWNTGTIQNCYNTGDVSGEGTQYVFVGGVCGFNGGTIENCYNTGDVSGTGTSSYGYVYAGGVCGWNTGTIENCYNTGDVSGTSEYGFVYAGGVCGVNDGTIKNCYNTGEVSGTATDYFGDVNAGGVCGWNYYGTIENCYNTGEVSGIYGFVSVGGVCGFNGGTIENCYNTGDVSGTGTSSYGYVYAGGVCGWNTGTIENCYNTGDVSGTSEYGFVYAGGVCGVNDGTIKNCYNTGEVSGTATDYFGDVNAGGVCGWNYYGTIENCYNTGEVSGIYGFVYAGGVCGFNGGTIQNCYNTGDVSGTSSNGTVYAGGVCGYNTGTITNCYWLAGTAEYGIGNPRGDTNAQSKTAEQFASGEVAWLLNEPQTEKPWGQGSNGMPVLKGNLPDGVTSYVPVRITIVMQDNSEQYRYTTEGNTVAEYPTGYAFFFKDGDTKTWISKGTQTYDADATIYAENMPLEKIQAKAPTCTENGNSAYWYSAAFDKYFKDENGVNEITAESTVIPAKGHGESEVKGAKEATCTEDGYTGDKVCKVCGEILERGTVIEKLGHVWGEPEWNWSEDGASCKVTFTCQNNSEHKESPNVTVTSEVKTPATCTESGVTTYMATFEFNGEAYTDTKEIADIPATGHNLTNIPAIAPTCTEAGNIEYWYCDTCDKYFSDETAAEEIGLADTVLEATGHSYENGKCTACGEIDPDFKAVIIEGANGSWQKGTKDGLSFTSNAAFAHFLKVQVDGKDLDASDYAVKEGSTIVTLKAEYLETLSVGKHTLAIVSETGTAETEFTIKAAAVADDTAVPQTGAGSNVALWIAVMLASGTALTGAVRYNRKKKYSR